MTNGEFLRATRESCNLSMAEVSRRIGVTDSRLSHIENDRIKEPSPVLLKSLARVYGIDIFQLFCRYGYLDEEQCLALTAFKRAEFLSADEIQHIQKQIDYCLYLQREGVRET